MDDHQQLAQGLRAQLRSVGDEDAVQDGFLRIIQRRAPQKLVNPDGYWYRASHSALRDHKRRRAAEDRAIRRWLEIQPGHVESRPCSEEQIVHLRFAIDRLAGRRRRLIDLELSGVRETRSLADAIGISEGATRVLRHRTYRQLRKFLAS